MKFNVLNLIFAIVLITNCDIAFSQKLAVIQIEDLYLTSPPIENKKTSISYLVEPSDNIVIQYYTCILNDEFSTCKSDDLLSSGETEDYSISVSIPKDLAGKYLSYCISAISKSGAYLPSENECRSELITNGDIDNKNALFSYLNQTKNFSLYNAPITDAKDDVSFVTSNSAALSLSSEGDASLIGYGSEVTNAPNLPKAKEVYSMLDGFAIKSESDDAIIWGQFDTTPSYINQV